MTASLTRHERRYRRLLWAYPGPYRRQHGAEIITTLLDMAEGGYGGPTVAETLHLVACGIRQRFRLPLRRPFAVLAAVLAAIALGGLAAPGGTWLGWQTGARFPSNDQVGAVTAAMLGSDPKQVPVQFERTEMDGPATVARVLTVMSPYSPDRVRAAIAADGWQLTSFTAAPQRIGVGAEDFQSFTDLFDDDDAEIVTAGQQWLSFTATKDGLLLEGFINTTVDGNQYMPNDTTDARVDVWALAPPAVRPLTVAGLLLGALAGWLFVAALTARVRQTGRAHRAAVAVLGVTAAVAAAAPTLDLYTHLYKVWVYDSATLPYVMYTISDQLPEYLVPDGTVVAVVALSAAVLIAVWGSRKRSRRPHQAPDGPPTMA
ncbi:hypothetical protein [Krasilnikovia sp. MM14-A1259]|uniref:hypothetical protein n=1 Tax=Krasilnikovia sp. MM14-A1259 TaxID=3373539 RepID=UPI0038147613